MLKRFIKYYKPHKKLFFLDMLASLIMSIMGLAYPIITRKVFKEYVPLGNDPEAIKAVIICALILLGLYFIKMLLKYFVQYYGHVIGVSMQATMRRDLFKHLQELPFSFYDEHETGKIMSRMTSDLQDVSELAHHGPENIFICGISMIVSFVYLCTINALLACIVFLCVPILGFIAFVMRKKMRKAFTESRKKIAVINASLESSISGIRVTKAFTNQKEEIKKFEKGNSGYVDARKDAYKAMGQFGSSTGFVTDLFNVFIIVGGGLFVMFNVNGVNIEDYLAFVVSISLFTSPLMQLIAFMEQLQDGKSGFQRFLEIMDTEPEVVNPNAVDVEHLNGNITFDHVFFDYETKDHILNDVSFKIKQGETIALVGESGGGKTTICHLIPNFYHVTSGKISIDDIDINDLTFKSLRSNIGIVQQDVFLFNGTILDNILYGKLDATMDEVIQACERANILEFINSLPNGINTEIGERGVKLSGGQKQRISIARVFLKDPAILILDEATSALDNSTEILIQQALQDLTKGRTTIVVAHRLSTIKNADRIFVVNKGIIAESGTHEELMKLNGLYHELYSLQFRVNELLYKVE